MKLFDKRTARVLATLAAFIGVAAFAYGARHVLITALFAVLFAYVLDPWVSRMESASKLTRGSRLLAVAEVYAILILAVAIVVLVFGNGLLNEARSVAALLPGLIESIRTGAIAQRLDSKHAWSIHTQLTLKDFLQQHSGAILNWIGSAIAQVAQLLSNAFWIALVPILAFFLLKDGRPFAKAAIESILPIRRRIFISAVLGDLNEMMAHYIRAQLIVSALALVFYMACLSTLMVPYAPVLAALGGILEFLPTLGPALSGATILTVAFIVGYRHVLVIVLVLGAWRITQDYFIFPRITGHRLRLHPFATIMAILIGAEIWGLVGAYIAVPVVASIRILRKRWLNTYATEELSGQDTAV